MNFENSISKNLTITENGTIAIHRIKNSDNSRVRIKQSEISKKIEAGTYEEPSDKFLVKTKSDALSDIEDKPKKKKDKKGKKHKKDKKHKKSKKLKKAQKRKINSYSEQLDTSNRKVNNGMLLSKILANSIDVRVVKNSVYLYDNKTGMFVLSNKQEVTTKINSWLDKEREDSYKFTSRDTDEAYRFLITNASIQREALDSAYNKPYVLCRNGVLELPTMKLLPFSPEFEFTFGVKTAYDENSEGEHFKEFIDFATNGDKDLKHLIQEIMGYAISNYSNKRTAFVFKGDTGTGKSTILDVIRQIVGQDNTCEVPVNLMEQEYYAATVLSAKLNIVPDHNNKVIKDVSKFKSFVSDTDVISGRNPCEKPFAERCKTKMLFGQNEFFRFSGVADKDLEAFFNRILYIPFNRQIEKTIDAFWQVLAPEYDYIFTWAMKGLKRLIEQDFKFTKCYASEKLKMKAVAQCNPEEAFFENCLKSAEDRYESSSAITDAFKYFCKKNNVEGNFNIISYLDKKKIPKSRKRINDGGYISSKGNPIYVYEGIRLRAKYRVSKGDSE
ncbi:MAG: hypothetical protein IJD97_00710 [Clostridia bacterium]|nr:hypothetical protein [Clostridia bacterium]